MDRLQPAKIFVQSNVDGGVTKLFPRSLHIVSLGKYFLPSLATIGNSLALYRNNRTFDRAEALALAAEDLYNIVNNIFTGSLYGEKIIAFTWSCDICNKPLPASDEFKVCAGCRVQREEIQKLNVEDNTCDFDDVTSENDENDPPTPAEIMRKPIRKIKPCSKHIKITPRKL